MKAISMPSGMQRFQKSLYRRRKHVRRDRKWQRRCRTERLETRMLLDAGGMPHGESMPHPDDPVLHHEHMAALALVAYSQVTDTAVQSGPWSDPDTWEGGVIPETDDHVLIPEGIAVTIDQIFRDELETVRVDGSLVFDPNAMTGLMVETIVVAPGGVFQMGTADMPIHEDVQAKLIIADDGEIDFDIVDKQRLSRGFISHGHTEIYGAETTTFLPLAEDPRKNDTQLVLAEIPTNWDVGDRLVLTGTNSNHKQNQDEELEILAIEDNVVTVDALQHNHLTPAADLSVYVANVSRNAVIESEVVDVVSRRGHVMFMHSDDVDVNYAGLYGLGRTDKRTPLEDPEFNDEGNVVDDTGLNPRGRYAVHFHRTGTDEDQALIKGSAVVDSPGWGIVNHSSNALIEDNVVFHVEGAAFVTEAGDEVGAFVHNIAIRSLGSGDGTESRSDVQDFAHQGDGFWFQGGGIEVRDNVAAGHRGTGFFYFTRALSEAGLGKASFDTDNLWDPAIDNGKDTIAVGAVPIRAYNNVAFANGTGFQTKFHQLGAKHNVQSVVDGLVAWNNRNAVRTPYTNNLRLENVRLIGNLRKAKGTAISGNKVTRNIHYINADIEGFAVGINMPSKGHNVVDGGRFNNIAGIKISTTGSLSRVIEINGDIEFGELTNKQRKGKQQHDIFLNAKLKVQDRDIRKLFSPDIIKLGTIRYNGMQLYYHEQAADFIPFKSGSAADYMPEELIGKTNAQLWEEFGLAVGGAVAPQGAFTDPTINALIGDATEYQTKIKMKSKVWSSELEGYQLRYKDPETGKTVKDPNRVDLREGWNVITRQVNGEKRSFLVFGDTTPPEFILKTKLLSINPADLKKGIKIVGQIKDDSLGSKNFKKRFKNLDKLTVQSKVDGTEFVVLSFSVKDRAGIRTAVEIEIVIDPDLPREHVRKRKNLDQRVIPEETLAALLGF